MAPNPGVPAPFPHLVVGQPDPERGPQAADGLGEEGLAVGVGDGGQGGVEGLAEQQGLVPPEGFLQDAVSAVVVKEGAGGRGGVRRPRGAQERVWGSKETRSEAAPAYQGGRLLTKLGCPRGSAVHAWDTCTWLRTHQARLMHTGLGVPHKPLGPGAPPKLSPSSCPLPTAPCSPEADPIAQSSPCCGMLGGGWQPPAPLRGTPSPLHPPYLCSAGRCSRASPPRSSGRPSAP